jgi:hypothetical protein
MTKEECLRMMRLLSALECAGLMREPRLPDYIYEQIADMVGVLEREILGNGAPGLERFFGKVGAQAIESPAQTPCSIAEDGVCEVLDCCGKPPQRAPAQKEPAAWTLTETLDKRETTTAAHMWFSDPQNSAWTPLYTHPPRREMEREPGGVCGQCGGWVCDPVVRPGHITAGIPACEVAPQKAAWVLALREAANQAVEAMDRRNRVNGEYKTYLFDAADRLYWALELSPVGRAIAATRNKE